MVWVSFVWTAMLRDLRRTGGFGVMAILLTGLAVGVIGGTLLGQESLARLRAAWWAELRVVALVAESLPRPDEMLATVRALPGVGGVDYVSKEEALEELREFLGPSGRGLDRLPGNPAPARLEVHPVEDLDAAGLERLVAALSQVPGVEEVLSASGWVEPTERLVRSLRGGGLLLGAGLGLVAVAAVVGAARVACRSRVDETAILRLVGAPESVVRGPLVLQSILLGGAGAALGWAVLLGLSEGAVPWVGEWFRGALGLAPLPGPGWRLSAALLGGGLAAGIAGGFGAGRP